MNPEPPLPRGSTRDPGETEPVLSSFAPPEHGASAAPVPPSSDPAEAEPPPAPPAPPERDPFWGYSDVFLFIGLAIPCMFLGWALIQGPLHLFHIHPAAHAAELLAEQLAGYLLLFCALRLIFRVQYDRPFWRSLGWTHMDVPFLWLVIFGFTTAITVAMATYLVHVPTTANPMTELLSDRTSIVLLAIFGVTLGPLCEELVFRGFLQPLLVRSLGPVAGILAAAIPFGLLHIPEYGNSWRHGLVIGLAGAAFGWMRHWTGSTKASTVMHASYNALFFFVLLSQGKDLPHT
jgi:membrane protease YdiL (CAAX protease family)